MSSWQNTSARYSGVQSKGRIRKLGNRLLDAKTNSSALCEGLQRRIAVVVMMMGCVHGPYVRRAVSGGRVLVPIFSIGCFCCTLGYSLEYCYSRKKGWLL